MNGNTREYYKRLAKKYGREAVAKFLWEVGRQEQKARRQNVAGKTAVR